MHTEFSLLDSIIKIPDLVREVRLRGDDAVGIADHGSLGGWVELYTECRKAGIKPILGVEFYHSLTEDSKENYHITLFARTRQGFDNIVKLNNLANTNFYKKPRVTTAWLREHGEGVIALSGCVQGYLAQSVLAGGFDWSFYESMAFDRFYLEVQSTQVKEQYTIRKAFLATGLPVVATFDSHYLRREDADAHAVSLGIMTNKSIFDEKAFRFNSSEYWLKTEDEARGLFTEAELHASDEIASLVEEFDIGFQEWRLPEVKVDPERELKFLSERLGQSTDEYRERLDYEFGVIVQNGFLPYFRIVADLCQYFDQNGWFRGWGRGSVSGSLVAFLYGITKIDPIRWGLYFERFLNPERVTPPDIDLDFMPEHKEAAIEFLQQKFGKVYQIGNYGTLATREVIKSVSRIMEHKTSLHEYVPKQAPVPTVAELMDTKVFAKEASLEPPSFMDAVLKLEGLKRNFSTHASGVVIGEDLPIRISQSGTNKGVAVTVWDMYSLEDLRYVKFDILGVTNLSVIDRVCRQIGLSVDDIPLQDGKTFDLICAGKTVGVFQWESDGYKSLIKSLHPDTFDELLDLNTLYRPGCLESGITKQYVDRKFGLEKVTQIHPKLDLKSFGLPLYQEDIMNMARVLAGFTLAEADRLRKAIGKKIKGEFEPLQEMWKVGCSKNGITEQEAVSLWDKIEKFARYTWNKAHAVAYTLISWWTAFLSANHPAEFFCELLNSAEEADRRRALLSECRMRGVRVRRPDINESASGAVVLDGEILLGLSGIKFIGEKVLASIMEERGVGYEGPEDVRNRTIANKRHIEFLNMAGAFGVPGTLEQERESLGYNVDGRLIDRYWWSKYCSEIGEVLDVHQIVTKKGDPMCFLKVEYGDRTESITVFPRQYETYKQILVKGFVGLFKVKGDILQFVCAPAVERLAVHVEKADEFLSFNPSMAGRPNVFSGGVSISCISLDEQVLHFIEREFGIERLTVN